MEQYSSFRVIARVRPPSAAAAAAGAAPCLQLLAAAPAAVLEATLLEKNKLVRGETRGQAPRVTTFLSTRRFRFDAAFGPPSTTAALFAEEVSPLVQRVVRGARCCVLAYGATGSGKTHTLTGSPGGGGDGFALLHMIAVELTDGLAAANAERARGGQPRLLLHATGGEVYQEELLDLGAPGKLRRMSAVTLRRVPVPSASPGELVDVIEAFIARRASGATNKNEHSSRSHALYSVVIEEEGGCGGGGGGGGGGAAHFL